jgi:hypothetical protein
MKKLAAGFTIPGLEVDDDAACKSCNCPRHRRSFRTNDCCRKCAYLLKYLEEVMAWDRHRPETLLHVSKDINVDPRTGNRPFVTSHLTAPQFAVWKDEHMRQIKQRLTWMRVREDRRRGIGIDGHVIERKLADLQRVIRSSAVYPKNASTLSHNFTKAQLMILYRLLDDIEETVPVRSIVNIGEVYDRIYKSQV